ncbi:MAG: beta-N-acetylhexosaminidase [Acidobacteria bacterium]|nr:beta-N-acetylhexosaminidase [Acidobacteriota bacterium]
MSRAGAVAVAALAAVTLASGGAPGGAAAAPTTAQLAGQRITWPVDGTTVSASMRAAIARGEVGSVILFSRNAPNPATLSRLTRQLQSIPRPAGLDAPLLVTVDQEGGLVKRLAWAPPTMSAARMGARLDPAGIRAEGAATGRAMLRSGVNADLAPVCDVAQRGGDLFRDGRAFGTTPAAVAADCTAFAQGLGDAGAVAPAKHFPGFGRARVNTDDAAVRVTAPRAVLDREMEPFRTAIAARVPMIMVSSIIFTALAPRPALLEPSVVRGLLRDQLGFRGVTITDAIDTPALRAYGGTAGASVGTAAAGMDLVIIATSEAEAAKGMRAVSAALESGRLPRADARASLDRVMALRRSLGR